MKVEIPEELRIYNVAAVWNELSGLSEGLIDFSKMKDFDGAGLQLIMKLQLRIKENKSGISIEGISSDIINRLLKYAAELN